MAQEARKRSGKFLIQILQRHIDKKLVTAGMLEKLSA